MIFGLRLYLNRINIAAISQNYKFNVFSYNWTLNGWKGNPHPDFETNQLKIAYATARNLCSNNLDNEELYLDTISSLLSHLNFITNNRNDYLQLSDSRLKRLRDFSKTTRVGELAQGVNYLFVQENLKFPFIIDFHLFYSLYYGNSLGKRKTPDFVILDEKFSVLGLFESKGTTNSVNNIKWPKGILTSALKQLETILQPCAKKLVSVCTFFENDSQNGNSSIHYAIKDKVCNPPSGISLRIFRQHYSSWFYLFGDFARSNQLLEPEGFNNLDDDTRYILGTDDNKVQVYWINRPLESFLKSSKHQFGFEFNTGFIHFKSLRFGIYKSVIDRLRNNNISEQINYPTVSSEIYIRFADGTVINVNR